MRLFFAALTVASLASGPSQAAAPFVTGRDLPQVLGSVRPEDQGLMFFFGSRLGVGWFFKDGSRFEMCADCGISLSYMTPICDTEETRWSLILGTQPGVHYEHYLGYGFSVAAEMVFVPRVQLWWYPTESFFLTLSLDVAGIPRLEGRVRPGSI